MLRQVYDSCSQGAGPRLYDALKACAFSQLTITQTGRLVMTSSGNGQTTTFALPPNQSGLTPVAIHELFEEFLTRFEDALTDLGIAMPADSSQDANIFAQMMSYLRSITGYVSNWMYLAK